jgi:dCMP deaminase
VKDPDKYFYDIMMRVKEQSTCKTRKVGCIIALDGRIVSEGWNSPPFGSDTSLCKRDKCNGGSVVVSGNNMETVLCVHAEVNAIGTCARFGIQLGGMHKSVIYTPETPCSECAKLIITAGIKEVVFESEYNTIYSLIIFKNAGVKIRNFFSEDYL